MQAHHVLRALGKGGDLVHVQGRGVGGQNGAGLHDAVQLFKHLFFDADFFEHGFNRHIGAAELVITQGRRQKRHALLIFVLLELAFFYLGFVIAADRSNAFVQGFLLHFQHLDADAGIHEVHGDTAAHGARTDDGNALDLARLDAGIDIRNLGGCALTQEQMAQSAALGCHHQVDENLALGGHAVFKLFGRRCFHRFNALKGCWIVFRHGPHHIAGKLEIGVTQRVLARQVTHQGQRTGCSHRARER